MARLAAVPQPAHLGRLRGLDLRDRLGAVLVSSACPRPGDAARPRRRASSPSASSACCRWAGAGPRGTGTATRRPTCCLPASSTPLVVSVHTVVSFDFAVSHPSGLAHHHLPALLRRRRHLLRLRDGADARDSDARHLRAARTSSRCATCRTWPRSCSLTGLIVGLRLRRGSVHRVVRRQPLRGVHDARTASTGLTGRSTGR